jgi:hypothetical protein
MYTPCPTNGAYVASGDAEQVVEEVQPSWAQMLPADEHSAVNELLT